MSWLPQETIRIKRDGGTLGTSDLVKLAQGIGDGSLSDAQVGAFAMAVHFRGMTPAECATFTMAMRDTGEVFDWRGESPPGPVLDKHSTGGVGDLVSLALGAMLAACGAWVPMIVGRDSRTRAGRSTSSSPSPDTSRGPTRSPCAARSAMPVSRSSVRGTGSLPRIAGSMRSATSRRRSTACR